MIVRYSLLWVVLAMIAIANGALREKTYGAKISELSAHQLSTVTGILFSAAFVYVIHMLWPLKSTEQAWVVGIIWFVATVLFEFVFGHFVMGHSWSHLLHDYNLLRGRVWCFFLLWVLIMPVVIRKLSIR